MPTAKTLAEYHANEAARRDTLRENAARRMRRGATLPPLPVPPKLARPLLRVAYEADGTYAGRLADGDEVPAGCSVRLEPQLH